MADGDKTYTQAELDAEVEGLKKKNLELLGKLKTTDERAKELEGAIAPWKGLDPEKVKAALAALEKADGEKHKQAGDWEAREKQLREQMAKEHAAIVGPLEEKLRQREAGLFKSVAERDALEAMGKPDIKGVSALLLPLLLPELDVQAVDDKLVTVVKGPDGKPRYRTTDNTLFTVEDRLKELRAKPEYGGAFQGSGGSGTGAEGRGGTGAAKVVTKDQVIDNLEGIAAGKVAVAP